MAWFCEAMTMSAWLSRNKQKNTHMHVPRILVGKLTPDAVKQPIRGPAKWFFHSFGRASRRGRVRIPRLYLSDRAGAAVI